MAAHTKITKEIGDEIKKLAKADYNEKRIAEAVSLARGTIKKFCKDNNIELSKRRSPEHIKKCKQFKDICYKAIECNCTIQLNKTLKLIGLHPDTAQSIFKKNPNLRRAVRSKKQAILEDRTLLLSTVQSRLPNQSDKVLSYENGKYKIQARDGFIYYKSSSKLYQGDPRGKSGRKINVKQIHNKLLQIGYLLISDSFTIKSKALKARCVKCNNVRTNRFDNFFIQQCPTCSNNGVSLAESEIGQWAQSLNFTTEKFKFIGKTRGKEIDIYIPSLKIGIEYCGLYWHSEKFKDQKYHHNKLKLAEQEGIRLITIFEDEWKNRQSQVKNFLKSILGIHKTRIYARKCEVKQVDKPLALQFLEDTHIQGRAAHIVAFGLYYQNELVGIVTGNKHHRQGINDFVLNRLSFKDGYQIVGGASKLLKSLIKYCKEHGYNKLISWSDNRWSQGNVYEKIGFILEQELRPDYSYVTPSGLRESKQSNTKQKLLAKGAVGTMNNTEVELADTLNYKRIWDCGKKRYSLNL